MEDRISNRRVGDSAIMPSVTVQIPMPPGVAPPAQPAAAPSQPTQANPSATSATT